jgi:molecular chaperone HtpG
MNKEGATEVEPINRASALWARPKGEIKAEEYEEFYKHVAHDFEAPLAWTHNRVEGKQEYISLLYVPSRAPFDLWDRDHRHGIKLYVRRVFIMDDAEQLIPAYLRFVRGIVDSSDLPLNISREILQKSRDIETLRAGSVRKVLDLLEELAEKDKDKYARFWEEFGRVLKEGIVEDSANRERIAKLLRFSSTHADEAKPDVSLAEYVARMKDGQKAIYYITAESFAAAKSSPHLEALRSKGIEVLLMHDRIDEWVVMHLTGFDSKPLTSVARGGLDLGAFANGEEKVQQEKAQEEYRELVTRIEKALGEEVKGVRVSARLTDSPACLVAQEDEPSANLARILKAAGQSAPASKPTLEINPGHPLVQRLKGEADMRRFGDLCRILLDQARLAEGGQLEDPSAFVGRLNGLLVELMK